MELDLTSTASRLRADEQRPEIFRQTLSDNFLLDRPEIVSEQVSIDRTRNGFPLPRSKETQPAAGRDRDRLHPRGRRGTLCVSSQVGCTLTCSFCHTGTQTLVRNLRRRDPRPDLDGRGAARRFPGGVRPDDGGLVPAPRARAAAKRHPRHHQLW